MKSNKLLLKFLGYMILGIIIILLGAFIIYSVFNTNYRFSDEENIYNEDNSKTYVGTKTVVEYNTRYKKVNINSKEDATALILKHSEKQKSKKECNNFEIKNIESELEQAYQIPAVNLCELDIKTANYLNNLIKYVYTNYPNIKGYMTNLTLSNVPIEESDYIASFVPSFTFATSNSKTSFPFVIKTSMLLNSKYYLDEKALNNVVNNSAGSGYFVPNATGHSIIAHEVGHFLSFVAFLKKQNITENMYISNEDFKKYYEILNEYDKGTFAKKILEEAYQEYIKANNIIGNYKFDDFRKMISSYSVVNDSKGNPIYDETIAESFHDVYVNKEKAHKESVAIINTLNKYLK